MKEGVAEYDPNTGNYSESEPTVVERKGHITNPPMELMNILYGGIVQDALTVRVKNESPTDVDYLIIDGKEYRPILIRALGHKTTYQVREKQ